MEQRQVNYVKLVFGITKSTIASKKPEKYKQEVETSIIGETLEEILKFNKDIEEKYKKVFGLKEKSEIKLINFKLIHNQGRTTYKL